MKSVGDAAAKPGERVSCRGSVCDAGWASPERMPAGFLLPDQGPSPTS